MRCAVVLLVTVFLTGCRYERSFLQMNSDSGVPFLGLQLSVDARDARMLPASEYAAQVPGSRMPEETGGTIRAQSSRRVSLPASYPARSSAEESAGPPADADRDSVADITRRLAAF